jgi:nucleotide-binding universal stress UspA family protein
MTEQELAAQAADLTVQMVSTIVVGVAPTDSAQRALQAGLELAYALDADIHLVNAFIDGPSGSFETTEERAAAERLLGIVAANSGIEPEKISLYAIAESPADALIQVAEATGADMIVVGNKGTQGARRVLGSVASAVVAHAPCGVYVVKST